MKTLIITEKPSVTRDVAATIGSFKKQGNWFENDEYIIGSAVGHLVELFMPEDIDKKLGYWRLGALPIIPEKFNLKPIEKTKAKLNELHKLIKRKDVDLLVNACDAGREGELIFTYIYELAKSKKPIKRLWMQSMTRNGIRKAFASLRDIEQMKPLEDAARCRSEADWLIGINGTRAFTTRIYGSRSGQVATVGRVQTPTLAMVLTRELAIRNFKSRAYWRIIGNFGISEGSYEGVYQRPDFKKSDDNHDRIDRIWDNETVDKLVTELKENNNAVVIEEKKRTRQNAPLLYDLTSLQREANNRYGLSARQTLQIAQALYEKHKVITYPRTDSRALPEDYITTCKETIDNLDKLKSFGQKVLKNDWIKPNKRIFNNARISDHFAIIPTGQSTSKLKDIEEKIFDMIARRFIAIFFPPAQYDVTTRISEVSGHPFKTEGKVLVESGWLEVYEKTTAGNENLPALIASDGSPPQAKVISIEKQDEETKPPPRYNEATLLSAMEGAGKFVDDDELAEAMKDNGLGTPATRAQTIEHIINTKYLVRDGRDLIPTAKAEDLLEFLEAVKVSALTSPSMTGEWEHKLQLIEKGKLTRDEFMKGIIQMTTEIVDRTKNFTESDADARVSKIIAPTDGKPMLETLRNYKSQDGNFLVYKTIGNRKFDEDEINTLVLERSIGPLDGFRSKAGKPFTAMLKMDEENKVKFIFENQRNEDGSSDGEIPDLSQFPVAGKCPSDEAPVHESPNAYICANYYNNGKKCKFRVSRTLLGRTIPREQFDKLLNNGKTDLLEKFRSNRTKRYFSAHLVLKDNGQIGFEFAKKKSTKKKKET